MVSLPAWAFALLLAGLFFYGGGAGATGLMAATFWVELWHAARLMERIRLTIMFLLATALWPITLALMVLG